MKGGETMNSENCTSWRDVTAQAKERSNGN